MRYWISTMPLLLVAALLLIGGANVEGDRSSQMLAAGFVLIGVWAGTEVGVKMRGVDGALREEPVEEPVEGP